MEPEDRLLIESYLNKEGVRGSECAFTNHYVWRDSWDAQWCLFRNALIVKLIFSGNEFLLPPIGLQDNDIESCAKVYREYFQGRSFEVGCFYDTNLDLARRMFPGCPIIEERDGADYIYLQKDLAQMTGRKYHGQKNHFNAFCKEHPDYQYEPITKDNLWECLQFAEKWCDERLKDDASIMEEKFALQRTFGEFVSLDLRGGAIRYNGKIQAFSIGKKINSDTAVLHFEKAAKGVRGLYVAICKEFASHAWGDVIYLNREEDMGSLGLRKAKENLHPTLMWKKYTVVVK